MNHIEDCNSALSRQNADITILTVDDNDSLRYSLTRSLQGGGYKVIEARDGAEALRLAEEGPDLITLDVHLPDKSGFEICRILKTNPKTAHIPVLHISATFLDTEHKVRGLEAADGYLTEPITREELLATVGALLRLKQAEREARMHAAEIEKARRDLETAHADLEVKVQERTMELSQRNEEIRTLTMRLLKLQDEERRRLARELHDSTGQMLAVMKVNLDRLKTETRGPDADSLIANSISINDDLTRQLRTISYLLHPPLLDETGLLFAVSWYVQGFSERSGIKVSLDFRPDFGRLPGDVEVAIFRVIQECLTNVHRHSGSSVAKIRLDRNEERVLLEVTDSGSGIPQNKFKGGKIIEGVGLMGIRERVRQWGGGVTITSSDKGTTFAITLSLTGDTQLS